MQDISYTTLVTADPARRSRTWSCRTTPSRSTPSGSITTATRATRWSSCGSASGNTKTGNWSRTKPRRRSKAEWIDAQDEAHGRHALRAGRGAGSYNYTILDRRNVGNSLIYKVKFEPKSRFEALAIGHGVGGLLQLGHPQDGGRMVRDGALSHVHQVDARVPDQPPAGGRLLVHHRVLRPDQAAQDSADADTPQRRGAGADAGHRDQRPAGHPGKRRSRSAAAGNGVHGRRDRRILAEPRGPNDSLAVYWGGDRREWDER